MIPRFRKKSSAGLEEFDSSLLPSVRSCKGLVLAAVVLIVVVVSIWDRYAKLLFVDVSSRAVGRRHTSCIDNANDNDNNGDYDGDDWVILVTVSNGYYDFFQNWLVFYNCLGLNNSLFIVAEDDAAGDRLEAEPRLQQRQGQEERFTIFRSDLNLDLGGLTYDSKAYNTLVSTRATHIRRLLRQGRNVLYSDVDTVWRKNPLTFLHNTSADGKAVDMWIQIDDPSFQGMTPYYCTGFMAIRMNNRTIEHVDKWEYQLRTAQLDQPVFNALLHNNSSVIHKPLPRDEFPSGQLYFTTYKDQPAKKEEAVVVHNNYIIGRDKKKERFVKGGLWFV